MQNTPILLWVIANSKSDLNLVKESAIAKYPELSDKILISTSVDDILSIVNDIIYIPDNFNTSFQPIKKQEVLILDGIYNVQDLNDKLGCLPKVTEIIYTSNDTKINSDTINRDKSSSVDPILSNMKKMYDLLPKNLELDTKILDNLTTIKSNLEELENLENTDICILKDNVVSFKDTNYNCPIQQPIIEYNSIETPDPIYNNTTESTYPSDFPVDCFREIQSINDQINTLCIKYSNLLQSIESIRKKNILSKIILAVETNRVNLYNKMLSIITNNNQSPNFILLHDSDVLSLFNNSIQLRISTIASSILINKNENIKSNLNILSEDFQVTYKANGKFDIIDLFLLRDDNVDWFADIINYNYSVSLNDPGFQLIEQYYNYLQLAPDNIETNKWKLDQNAPLNWINSREVHKQSLLTNIDNEIINVVLPNIIKSDMTNLYSDILGNQSLSFILSSNMIDSLNIALQISISNINYANTIISRFNDIDTFIKNFNNTISNLSNKISDLPCLQSSIKKDTGNPEYKDPFNSKGELDSFYMPNPNMPQFDKLSYWKKFAEVSTITGLSPSNWSYGTITPTPNGPIGIPMPIIWKPIFVIPTPISIYVFFIGQCGIMPAPYLYSFSGLTQSSGFILTLRGSSDPLKMMPYQIRSKTQTIVSSSLQSTILSKNIMKSYVPDLNKQSVSDQKKFTEFNNGNPNNFIPSNIKPLLSPFSNVLSTIQNIFTKKSFGSTKTGLISNPNNSNILPKIFSQDDLPSYDRLSIKNIPFLIYTNSFCLVGSYTGGLPVTFPPFPKYSLPVPPGAPPIPDSFI